RGIMTRAIRASIRKAPTTLPVWYAGFLRGDPSMRIPIRPTGPGGLGPAHLSIAAMAVALAMPGLANAAPPVAAVLCSEMVGQAQFGTIKGRIVWGGEKVPTPKVLE